MKKPTSRICEAGFNGMAPVKRRNTNSTSQRTRTSCSFAWHIGSTRATPPFAHIAQFEIGGMLPQILRIVNRFWKKETIYTIKVQLFGWDHSSLLASSRASRALICFRRRRLIYCEKERSVSSAKRRIFSMTSSSSVMLTFFFKGRTYYHLIAHDSIMQYFILKYATKYDKVRQKERQSNAII